jgi:predicted hydrocarbon binding protein
MGHEAGRGRLLRGGARFLMIRPETLVGLQRALEARLGAEADDVLVAGGRAGGHRATALLGGDTRARVEALLRMGAEIGWGHFVLERLTEHEFVVTVDDSPFVEAHGPAERPVCHLTRGVLLALAETLFGPPVAVRESACAATGARRCRFESARA